MDIFVQRPLLAIVISVVLLLAGLAAASKIPVLQFPQIESASLVITTTYPGSSAEVVQGFITDPIEQAAMTIPGVDYVDSTTTAGLSTVTAWLELNEDSTRALAELSTRLAQLRYELPDGAEYPAVEVVRADRPAALFYLDVHGEAWTRSELTDYLERQVNPLFAAINGVQRVGLEGGAHGVERRLAGVGVGHLPLALQRRDGRGVDVGGRRDAARATGAHRVEQEGLGPGEHLEPVGGEAVDHRLGVGEVAARILHARHRVAVGGAQALDEAERDRNLGHRRDVVEIDRGPGDLCRQLAEVFV